MIYGRFKGSRDFFGQHKSCGFISGEISLNIWIKTYDSVISAYDIKNTQMDIFEWMAIIYS